MTATFTLQAIAEMSAARIVDCLLEGSLIAFFAGLVLRTSRRQSSGKRFAVWFSALMAIAVLPFLGMITWPNGTSSALAQNAVRPVVTVPGSWALYLFAVWALVAVWCLMRVGVGLWHLRTLRKGCVPVDPAELDVRLRETLEHNGGSRRVALCTSEQVQVPTAIGLVRPLIVIPQWIREELSTEELNQILLHELAHLRRWDDWTNLAQQIVKALFFFHPAVWWIERKISLEREMACDDAVLAATAEPRAYAECLAHLAERTLVRRSLALAQAALGRVRQMSLRVAQILDAKCPRGTKNAWRPAVVTVAGFALTCGLIGSRAPRAVAFEDQAPSWFVPAMTSATNSAVPVVPATFKTATKEPSKMVPRARLAGVTKATSAVAAKNKLLNGGISHSSDALASAHNLPFWQRQELMHPVVIESVSVGIGPLPTNCGGSSAVSTEAVFILVSEPGMRQPVYEVHMWRLTVFQPVDRSASQQVSPRKT